MAESTWFTTGLLWGPLLLMTASRPSRRWRGGCRFDPRRDRPGPLRPGRAAVAVLSRRFGSADYPAIDRYFAAFSRDRRVRLCAASRPVQLSRQTRGLDHRRVGEFRRRRGPARCSGSRCLPATRRHRAQHGLATGFLDLGHRRGVDRVLVPRPSDRIRRRLDIAKPEPRGTRRGVARAEQTQWLLLIVGTILWVLGVWIVIEGILTLRQGRRETGPEIPLKP